MGKGVELRRNEIYGPVVPKAYDLESKVAKHPRIVVGAELVHYLETAAANPEDDVFAQHGRALAGCCLSLLGVDTDGQTIVDYLGDGFRQAVTQRVIPSLPSKAYTFVCEEAARFAAEGDGKLAARYEEVSRYFESRLHLWQKPR